MAISRLTTRRQWLQHTAGVVAGTALSSPLLSWGLTAKRWEFPRDFGSHPELGTEWWYITGHVQAGGGPWGFQLTFFRSRVEASQTIQSPLAAKQLIMAHAAVCDVRNQRLLHDQRIARAGLGLAHSATSDTHVYVHDWVLQRHALSGQPAEAASRYSALLQAQDFMLDLQLHTTQPVLLQGTAGLSRKGPDTQQASYYYSQPQLHVTGFLTVQGQRMAIEASALDDASTNRAWLDHECSTALMHSEAQGWDWVGMNLLDGSALTAFQLRRSDGSALWAGGSMRAPDSAVQSFSPEAVRFEALQWWTSANTATRYPVRWLVHTPSGRYVVRPVAVAQELDSRATTGAIYWEGLSDLLALPTDMPGQQAAAAAMEDHWPLVGRGYLEMTGYAQRLQIAINSKAS